MVRVQKTSGPGDTPSLFLFTLYFIYKNLYILGAFIIRRQRRFMRRAQLFFKRRKGSFYAGLHKLSRLIASLFRRILVRLKAPFLRIRTAYREQKPIIRSKKEKGVFPLASYLEVAEAVARLLGRFLATIVNHVLPIGALLVLAFIINGFFNQSFGLRVVYKDQEIGYIKSESDFDIASRDVQSRVISESTESFPTDIPSFELVICEDPNEDNQWILLYNALLKRAGIEMVTLEDFTTTSELADSIVALSGQEVVEGFGLYIDNRFYGAVTEKDGILNMLESMRRRGMSGKPGERVEFEKSIGFNPGQFLKSSLREEDALIELLTSNDWETEVYVVEEDDTPSGIADKTGVPYSLLKEMNPDIEENLMPGDEIITRVQRPFLTVKSIYTDTYEEPIPFETEEIENVIYAVGYREPQREGEDGVREVTAEITMINGIEQDRKELSSTVIREPVTEQVVVGTNTPAPVVNTPVIPSQPSGQQGGQTTQQDSTPSTSSNSGGFIWPIASGYVSAGLGGYPGHTGVDIAGPAGTPIYAAASGRVTKAKWTYYSYGIHCEIDHGNGYTTLYAHMSNMIVSAGQYVEQGQVIGYRGRTGNTSGNHLHFEVRQNGTIKNPLNYVNP